MRETVTESERPPSWRKVLSREELDSLLEIQNWRGWFSLGLNWAIVFASFSLVAWAPNPATIFAALILIGGRQLGMAVIMHEAAHHTMFTNRKLNDLACNWLLDQGARAWDQIGDRFEANQRAAQGQDAAQS